MTLRAATLTQAVVSVKGPAKTDIEALTSTGSVVAIEGAWGGTGKNWELDNTTLGSGGDASLNLDALTLKGTTVSLGKAVNLSSKTVIESQSVVSIGSTLNAQLGQWSQDGSAWTVGGPVRLKADEWNSSNSQFGVGGNFETDVARMRLGTGLLTVSGNYVARGQSQTYTGMAVLVSGNARVITDTLDMTKSGISVLRQAEVSANTWALTDTVLTLSGPVTVRAGNWSQRTSTLNAFGITTIQAGNWALTSSNVAFNQDAFLNLGTLSASHSAVNFLGNASVTANRWANAQTAVLLNKQTDLRLGEFVLDNSTFHSVGTTNIKAEKWANTHSQVTVRGSGNFQLGRFENSASTLNFLSDVILTTGSWQNNQTTFGFNGLTKTQSTEVTNDRTAFTYLDDAVIKANSQVDVGSSTVYNKGVTATIGQWNIDAQSRVSAGNDMAVTGQGLSNKGTITANGTLRADIQTIDNTGQLTAHALMLRSEIVTNNGVVQADAVTVIGKRRLYNAGQMDGGTALLVSGNAVYQAENGVLTGRVVTVNAGQLALEAGSRIQADHLAMTISTASITGATIRVEGDAVTTINALTTTHSQWTIGGAWRLNAESVTETGTIGQVGSTWNAQIGQWKQEGSTWTIGGPLVVKSTEWTNKNSTISGTDMVISAGRAILENGVLAVSGNMVWTGQSLSQLGKGMMVSGNARFNLGDWTQTSSTLNVGRNLSVQAKNMRITSSNMVGNNGVFIVSDILTNKDSFLNASTTADIQVGTWSNEGAQVVIGVAAVISANHQTDTKSVFVAGKNIMATVGQWERDVQSTLSAGGDVSITVKTLANNGAVTANGVLAMTGGTIQNAGRLSAQGMRIQAEQLSNLGTLQSMGDVLLRGVVSNAGDMASGRDIQVEGALTNSGVIRGTRAVSVSGNENTIVNEKTGVIGAKTINFTDKTLVNKGDIIAAGTASSNVVIGAGQFTNEGFVHADAQALVAATAMRNDGRVEADVLRVTGNLENRGIVVALNALNIAGKSATNNGTIRLMGSGKDISIKTITYAQNTGVMGSAGSITNEAKQILLGGAMVASKDIVMSQAATVRNVGTLTAGRLVAITTTDNLTNAGIISSKDRINLSGKTINTGTIWADGITWLTGQTDNQGRLGGQGELVFSGTVTNSGQAYGGAVTVQNGNLVNSGTVSANRIVDIYGSLTNQGTILSNGYLTVIGDQVTNSGTLHGNSQVKALVSKDINNSGLISSGQKLDISAQAMTNSGTVQSASHATLQGNLSNTGRIQIEGDGILLGDDVSNMGKLLVDGALGIQSKRMINSGGDVSVGKGLTITTNTLINQSHGTMSAGGDLGISGAVTNHFMMDAKGNINVKGDYTSSAGTGLFAGKNLTFASGSLSNNGTLEGQNVTITAASMVHGQYGVLRAKQDLSVAATTLLNNGQMAVSGNMALAGVLEQGSTGVLLADKTLSMSGPSLKNAGAIESKTALTLSTDSFTQTAGQIASLGTLTLSTPKAVISGGVITSKQGTEFKNLTTLETSGGKIVGNGNFSVTAGTWTNSGATVSHQGNVAINASQFTNSGTVSAGNDVLIYTPDKVINNGLIGAEKDIAIYSAKEIINQSAGSMVAKDDLYLLNTKTLKNDGLLAGRTSNQVTGVALSNSGRIQGGATTLVIDSIDNTGAIESTGVLSLKGITLTNTGKIVADNALIARLTGALTNDGTMYGDTVSVNAASIWNMSNGKMTANTKFESESPLVNNGLINSFDAIQLKGTTLDNTGKIEAKGSVSITGQSTTNSGRIYGDNEAIFKLTGQLTNNGEISGGAVTTRVANVQNNAGGTIAAERIVDIYAPLSNVGKINCNGVINVFGTVTNTGAIEGKGNVKLQGGSASNSGRIVSNAETILDVSGEVTNSGELYGNAVTIHAQNIQNTASGKLSADRILDLYAPLTNAGLVNSKGVLDIFGNITNSGTIQSDKLLFVVEPSVVNQQNGKIYSADSMNLSTALTNRGQIQAEKAFDLTGSLTNAQGAAITAKSGFTVNASGTDIINDGTLQQKGEEGSMTLLAKTMTNAGVMASGKYMDLDAQTMSNSGTMVASRDVLLRNAVTFTNSGVVKANKDIAFYNTGTLLNQSTGKLVSDDDIDIRATTLYNQGGIKAAQIVDIAGNITNAGGIESGSDMNLYGSGYQLDNTGQVSAGGNLAIRLDRVNNAAAGSIQSQGNSTYQAALTNDGRVYANKDITVQGPYLRNTNEIKAGLNMTINLTNGLENTEDGLIKALVNLNVEAQEIHNDGQMQGVGHPVLASNMTLKADTIVNHGVMGADTAMTIEAKTLDNSGMVEGGTTQLRVDSALTNTGAMVGIHGIGITGGPNLSVVNKGGTIISEDGDTYIQAQSVVNKVDGGSSNQTKIGSVTDIWSGYVGWSYQTRTSGVWDVYLQENPWTKQGIIASEKGVTIKTDKTENIGSTIKGGYVDIQTTELINKGYGNEVNYVSQAGYTKPFGLNLLGGNVTNGTTIYDGNDRYQFSLSSVLPGINESARHNANALITGDYVHIQATTVTNGTSSDQAQVASVYGYSQNGVTPGTSMRSAIEAKTIDISATMLENNGFIQDDGKGTNLTVTTLKNSGAIAGSAVNINSINTVTNNGVIKGTRVYVNTNGNIVNNEQIRGTELELVANGAIKNNETISANTTTLKIGTDFKNYGAFKTNNLDAEIGRNFYNDDFATITGYGDHYWDIKGTTDLYGTYKTGSLKVISADKVTSGEDTIVQAKDDINIKSEKSIKIDGSWQAADEANIYAGTNIGVNGTLIGGNLVRLDAGNTIQNSGSIAGTDISITSMGWLYNNASIIGSRHVGIVAKGGLTNGYDSIQELTSSLVDLDSSQKGRIQGQDVSIETYSDSGLISNKEGSVIQGTDSVSVLARMASIINSGVITGKNKVKVSVIDNSESIYNLNEISTSGNYQLQGNYQGGTNSKLKGTTGIISGQSFYSSGTIDTKQLLFEGQNEIRNFGSTTFDVLQLNAPNAALTQGGTWNGGIVVGTVGSGTFTGASTTKVDTLALRTSGNIQTNGKLTANLLKFQASGTVTNTGLTTTQVALIDAQKGITNTNKLTASEYAQFKSSQGGFNNKGVFDAANVSFNFHDAINKTTLLGLSDPKFAKITQQQLNTIDALSGGVITIKGVQYRITNVNGTFALDEINSLTTKLATSAPSLFKANITLAETNPQLIAMKSMGNKDFTAQLLTSLSADRKLVLIAALKGEGDLRLAIGTHEFSKDEKTLLLDLLEGRKKIEDVTFVNVGERKKINQAIGPSYYKDLTPTLDNGDREWLIKFLDERVALLNGPSYLRVTESGQANNGIRGLSGVTRTVAGIQLNAADFGLGDLGKIVTFGADGRLYLDGVALGQVHISESAQFGSDETLRTSELSDNWFMPDTVVDLKSKMDIELDKAMQIDALLAKAGRDLNQGAVGITANRFILLEASRNMNLAKDSTLKAQQIALAAGVDLNAIGAKLKGLDALSLSAGHDVNLTATINETKETSSVKRGKTRTTTTIIDQEAQKVELESGGTIAIKAGNNATLVGVDLRTSRNIAIDAGHDVAIRGIEEIDSEKTTKKKSGGIFGGSKTSTHTETDATVEESTLTAAGGISIKSGNEVTAEGIEIISGQKTTIMAAGDVTITGVMESKTIEDKTKKKGFLSGKETKDVNHDETVDKSGITALGGISITSTSGNVALIATSLKTGAGKDIEIEASKNIVVGNLVEKDYTYHFEKKTQFAGIDFSDLGIKNGKLQSAGVKQEASVREQTKNEQNVVGSDIDAGGAFKTKSGGDTTVLASTISGSSVDMEAGKNLAVLSVAEVQKIEEKKSELTNTFTETVGNTVVDTATVLKETYEGLQVAYNALKEAKDNGTAAAEIIMLEQTVVMMKAKYEAVATKIKNTSGTYGFYVGINMTTKGIEETSTQTDYVSKSSGIVARDGDLNLKAKEKLTIQGSDVVAQNGDTRLKGKSVEIVSAEDSSSQQSGSSEVGSEIELATTAGTKPTLMDAHEQTNMSEGSSISHRNSRVLAGNGTIKIESEEDTLVKGANIDGKNVDLTGIGGDLRVESEQNESAYKARGEGYSIGSKIGYNDSKTDATRVWVENQTSIIGREGVKVKADDLTLKGGVIANIKDDGTDGGNLEIEVKTLKTEDLANVDHLDSLSRGINVGIQGKSDAGAYDATTLGVKYANGGHHYTSRTTSTIGEGVLKIGGEEADSNAVNRDIDQAQGETSSRHLGGMNVGVDVGIGWITDPTNQWGKDKAAMKDGAEAVVKIAGDAVDVGQALVNTAEGYMDTEGEKEELKRKMEESAQAEKEHSKLSLNDLRALQEMKDLAEKNGYDLDTMSTVEKLKVLEGMRDQKESLTSDQKLIREAIWVSLENSKDWESLRSKQLDSMLEDSVKSLSFWYAKEKWSEMDSEERKQFLQKYSDQNNKLIGNTNTILVTVKDLDDSDVYGYYDYRKNQGGDLIFNEGNWGFNNFFETMDTLVHEGVGHGYQDYTLENKEDYIKKHPELASQVDQFELSYNKKTRPGIGIDYSGKINEYIYSIDPAEEDAWELGNKFQEFFKNSKNVMEKEDKIQYESNINEEQLHLAFQGDSENVEGKAKVK